MLLSSPPFTARTSRFPLRWHCAGPLSMTLRGGQIVDLEVAGYEVWHGLTFPYRDPD